MGSNGTRRQSVEPGPAAVGAAGKMLAERGIFGMAWLDKSLVVRTSYGRLIDFLAIGRQVTDTLPPLIGLEDDIQALRDKPGAVVELPSVAIVTADRATPRCNISVFWFAEAERFLLVVSRAVSRSDLEAQLAAQMRARLMAEAEVTAKSKELARANNELSRANRDLEDFASIIAHDLAGPMRSMRYLVDDLEKALADIGEGAEDATAFVGRLRSQSQRLSTMLRDLHEYSSIGRKQDALEEIDTGALARAVVEGVHRPAGFAIAISGPWPRLTTLAAPLDLVLRNLVENAVKHHDRPHAGHVTLTAREAGSHVAIVVADDGPGIDAAHQDAVFLPFRTLGRSGAGTGMGLAFVKRTVESVGGSLTLASDPAVARGAEFRILWPRIVAC